MAHELGLYLKNDRLIRYRMRHGHIVERNVSHLLIEHLSFYCCIEHNTTLRELFTLCYPHRDLLDKLLPHCHVSEYIEYGLNSKYLNDFDRDRNIIVIRFVKNSYKNGFDICIVGEDKDDKNRLIYYSPISTDISRIIDYKVIIKNDCLYNSSYYNDLPYDKFIKTICNVDIRLFDLILLLFYEFSWFGDPIKSREYWKDFENKYCIVDKRLKIISAYIDGNVVSKSYSHPM